MTIEIVNRISDVLDYVWAMSQQDLYASYPRFDSKERIEKELIKAVSSELFCLISLRDDNKLCGICCYFWYDEEKYAQTTLLLLDDKHGDGLDLILDFVSAQLPGYDFYIGLPNTNWLVGNHGYMDESKRIEHSIVMNMRNPWVSAVDNPAIDVTQLNVEDFQEYAPFHDKHANEHEMYYTSSNIRNEIESFRIFVTKDKGQTIASIFVYANKELSDVVGLFVDAKYKNKGIERALIQTMVNSLVNEFGAVREILYFIETDSKHELEAALTCGFVKKDEYSLFKYSL